MGLGLGHVLAERCEVGTQAGGQGPAREAEKGRVMAPGEALGADTKGGVWTDAFPVLRVLGGLWTE